MIVESKLVVSTEKADYNADLANGLSGLATNSSITISNQTVEATGIAIEGKECKHSVPKIF